MLLPKKPLEESAFLERPSHQGQGSRDRGRTVVYHRDNSGQGAVRALILLTIKNEMENEKSGTLHSEPGMCDSEREAWNEKYEKATVRSWLLYRLRRISRDCFSAARDSPGRNLPERA